jgi:TetR/AcrR family transcriptional repressor of nem operon
MGREQGNREKILDAAAALFRQGGLRPTSLDEVLERSGVCRSNFYYHFKSKEDLGLAVLNRQALRFEETVIRGILEDERESPRRRLSRLFDLLTSELRADAYRSGCPFGSLAAELSGLHPEFQSRLSAFFRKWEEAVERCLREGVAQGEFRDGLDTRRTATALVSQIEGAVLLTKTHGHCGPIEDGAQVILKLLESR